MKAIMRGGEGGARVAHAGERERRGAVPALGLAEVGLERGEGPVRAVTERGAPRVVLLARGALPEDVADHAGAAEHARAVAG